MWLNALVSTYGLAVLVAAQSKTAVSDTVFNNIIQYTQYAAASYADSCAQPPSGSRVLDYFTSNATDAQATLFQVDSAKQVIIAFRGTSSPQDFSTDLLIKLVPLALPGVSCPACQVAQGFQAQYVSIASAVFSAISTAKQANPSYSLIVTGHSLGGALAALASASLAGLGFKPAFVYTYGEPRNGNANFTTLINGQISPANYYRVTHANDGVPQIPGKSLTGYQHHGTEYWESSNVTNSASTTFQCPGIEPTTCNAAQPPGNNFINAAHISYSNGLIGNSLFIAACGAKLATP